VTSKKGKSQFAARSNRLLMALRENEDGARENNESVLVKEEKNECPDAFGGDLKLKAVGGGGIGCAES